MPALPEIKNLVAEGGLGKYLGNKMEAKETHSQTTLSIVWPSESQENGINDRSETATRELYSCVKVEVSVAQSRLTFLPPHGL